MRLKHFSLSHRRKQPGAPPGTLVYTGQRPLAPIRLSVITYDGNGIVHEEEVATVADLASASHAAASSWINITGLHDVALIEDIGQMFDIHPLLLEDILNTNQRPKIEQHDDNLTLIVKVIHWNEAEQEIDLEQVSIVLGPGFVLTFQEQERDIFDPVRQRIRMGNGRLHQNGPDYLAYALLDMVVDNYFVILEYLGERIEAVEEELIDDPSPETLSRIQQLKREMLYLRRAVWPLREIVGQLQRGTFPIFADTAQIFLRDVYEHTIQVIDTIETFRDIVSSLLDIYLSSLSNKMNEVMKVLTVIATLFIPLTFVAGVYGMNFRYMPELGWRWGYPAVWVIFILMSAAMLAYFRHRDWL